MLRKSYSPIHTKSIFIASSSLPATPSPPASPLIGEAVSAPLGPPSGVFYFLPVEYRSVVELDERLDRNGCRMIIGAA